MISDNMILPQTVRRAPGLRAVFFIFIYALFLPAFAEAQTATWSILWGNDTGLYSRDQRGRVTQLFSNGKVQKIIRLDHGSQAAGWALLTDQGIWISKDLSNWEQRNRGLPERVIKVYEDGEKSFITTVQEIKNFSVDTQTGVMVCAVKDAVYLSRNSGMSWESLGMPNYRSNGIKAVAVTSLSDGGLTVFCSHNIYGIYYINPDSSGAKWIEMNGGLETLETTNNPDEISDIAVVVNTAGNTGGNTGGAGAAPAVYASQSFRRRLYKLDWDQKTWNLIWSDGSAFGAMDSLFPGRNTLNFIRDGGIAEINLSNRNAEGALVYRQRADLVNQIKTIPENSKLTCAVLRVTQDIFSLSELWLLNESIPASRGSTAQGADKYGIYLPVNHAMDPASLKPYLDIIENRGLNMIVIDMKDDLGRLRFTPQNSSITNIGRVFRPVDIEAFLKTMKERGIYTVARLVVFKDPEAARKNGGTYAVWDGPNNKPWEGYYDTRRRKPLPGQEPETNPALVTTILPTDDPSFEILRTWYDEKWVDPYSEEIWDYNAKVAEELCRRGFDEIQFDYIRFPTDGVNLGDARYRWRDNGMDMDSAILSFLRHVRSRVVSPISVDIYGANGWYRTGARTGQEVELLAPWVDIICPMYYPSHFEQAFLAHDPPELRPYRIYYQGTLRTHFIARGRVIVRPWAQAFYLNVSYDRRYYNTDYVRQQADGVRAAGNGGLTYWNNSGRYEDIP